MAPSVEVLIFEIEGHRHALPVSQVRELLPALTTTPVPGAPPGVTGVINLRGVIVPVLDVRHRFGLPSRPLSPSDHFIVISIEDRPMVLHVDRALELTEMAMEDVVPTDRLLSDGDSSAKMVQCGQAIVVLHEAHHFLGRTGTQYLASVPMATTRSDVVKERS